MFPKPFTYTYDELVSIGFAAKVGLLSFIQESQYDGIPLGYNFLNYILINMFGYLAPQIFSILVSIVFVFKYTTYFLKNTSKEIAIFALVLLACSNTFALHLGEVRPYTLILLISLYTLIKTLDKATFQNSRNIKDYSKLIFINVIGMWLHHIYSIIFFTHFIYLILLYRKDSAITKLLIKIYLIVTALSVGSFYHLIKMPTFFKQQWEFIPKQSNNIINDLGPIFSNLFSFLGINFYIFIIFSVLTFLFLKLRRKERGLTTLKSLSLQGFIFLISIYLISSFSQSLLYPRYNLYLYLIGIMIVPLLVDSLKLKKIYIYSLTGLVVITSLIGMKKYRLDMYEERVRWNKVISEMRSYNSICIVKMDNTLDQLTRSLIKLSEVKDTSLVENNSSDCPQENILKIWGPRSNSQAKGKNLLKPNAIVSIELTKKL